MAFFVKLFNLAFRKQNQLVFCMQKKCKGVLSNLSFQKTKPAFIQVKPIPHTVPSSSIETARPVVFFCYTVNTFEFEMKR